MFKSISVALLALFFFAACQNAPKTEEKNRAEANSMKTEETKATEPKAVEVSNTEMNETPAEAPNEKSETPAEKPEPPKEKKPDEPKKIAESAPVEKAKETPQKVVEEKPVPLTETEKETTKVEKEEEQPVNVDKTPVATVPSHDAWDGLLRKYVSSSGKVDYAGFKSEKGKLEAYLKTLQDNPPVDGDWSRKEKLAYWINVYNAFTVKLIVDNYPTSSITKLEGGKPWDKKWIKIGGKTYSLNNVENDIIRPRFNEPRIHFAVNCAAKSCPPLLNRAWTADNLESNFAKQAKAFINNPKYNSISAKKVQVSKIFEWYASDFGNLIDYLNKYSDTKINANAQVGYLEYDWALNN